MELENARQALLKAERDRIAMGPVSDMITGGLSLEDAHNICETTIRERLASGETHVGYKVGFTNIPVRDKMGLPDSTYGYLMDSMVLESAQSLDMGELIAPKIECEICFKLSKDLGGKHLTIEQVLAATEGVSAAFEICDARIKDWKCPYNDFFADNGFSARIILPNRWLRVDELDLLAETVALRKEGEEIASGQGEMAMGHPANAVIWLASKLADRNKSLKAGQLVMTGTLTPILPIVKGSTYVASFTTLGDVSQTFA